MARVHTHLFIGGIQDGNRIVFPERHDRAVFKKISSPAKKTVLQAFAEYEMVQYRREYLRSGDTIFYVWVEESLPVTDALRMLLENYSPKAKSQEGNS